MPAHPDARLAVEPRVAAGIGPFHKEDAVGVPHHDVGNELLPGRRFLGDRSIQEVRVLGHGRAELGERGRIGPAQAAEITAAWHPVKSEHEDALGHWVPSLGVGG
jgi:hypothetical protein